MRGSDWMVESGSPVVPPLFCSPDLIVWAELTTGFHKWWVGPFGDKAMRTLASI